MVYKKERILSSEDLDHILPQSVEQEEIARLNERINSLERGLTQGEHPQVPTGIIVWPTNGAQASLQAGFTTFDLKAGKVRLPNGTSESLSANLEDIGSDFVQSMHIHPDTDVFSAKVEGPKMAGGTFFFQDRAHHFLTHTNIVTVTLHFSLPLTVFVTFGSHSEAGPVEPVGDVSAVARVGALTTSSQTFQNIVMRPVAINPLAGTSIIMTEAEAQANSPLLNAQVVSTGLLGLKTWWVRNTSGNEATVRVQGTPLPVSPFFVTDDTTDPAPNIVIPANSGRPINQTTRVSFSRIQGKSTGGSEVVLDIKFVGYSGL